MSVWDRSEGGEEDEEDEAGKATRRSSRARERVFSSFLRSARKEMVSCGEGMRWNGGGGAM